MDASSRNTREATSAEMQGALPANKALEVPAQGYKNPGPTQYMRGVEENTNQSKGSSAGVRRDGSNPAELKDHNVGRGITDHFQTWPLEAVARGPENRRD